MRSTSRRKGLDESGFTLIELMASLTVLAIGIVSTASVILSSLDVGSQGNTRARAVALATREADSLRAVPYDRLGFASTQLGYVANFEGRTTVQAASPLVAPEGPSQVSGGTSFAIRRHIVWADSATSATTYAQAYKLITVLVSWNDRAGGHQARQDALMYPGGLGAYTGPQGSVTTTTTIASGAPAAPASLTATVPSGAAGASTVSLSWVPASSSTPPVATWVIQYSTTSGFSGNVVQVTDSQPAASPSFEVTGLSGATTYWFRVAGRSSSGELSTWAYSGQASTSASAVASCQLGAATITPSGIKRANASSTYLKSDASISVNTNATTSCTGLYLSYSPTAGSTATVYLSQTSGGLWTGTVDGDSTSWDTGNHRIDFRTAATAVLGTVTLTVCVHNAKQCP
ncbi:MAG TPA: fibronectin type III domain-containing protein [Acidimicrobiales bacterium]|nr:fibronectin type III domain-containing protein [Acidimicrobiales bacterium]